jgi:hypothetical protein
MFELLINNIFIACVEILQFLGGSPGEYSFGYNLVNLIIFVILQPSLILSFLILWRLEKKKNEKK